MNRLKIFVYSLGAGAGLMYFYDPSRGGRRRALLRDQVNGLGKRLDKEVYRSQRDLRNRVRGILANAMAWVSDEPADDWLVAERARAELGRMVRNPRDVKVTCEDGCLSVSGPVPAPDLEQIITRLGKVRGVHSIANTLNSVEEPSYLEEMKSQMAGNWPPGLRLAGSLAGGFLALYGGVRRGPLGWLLSLAGLSLATRSVANLNLEGVFGNGGNEQNND